MNKLTIICRLCCEPSVKYYQDKPITTFRIASDVGYGEKKKTLFKQVASFGKTAEYAGNYLNKGDKIIIFGRIEDDEYTNKEGIKVIATKIIAEEIQMMSKYKPAAGSTSNQQETLPDEEIPF